MYKGKVKERIKKLFPNVKDNDMTMRLACLSMVMSQALNGSGSLNAFETFRDTSGEKPTDVIKQENTNIDKLNIDKKSVKKFADTLRDVLNEK